jgi:gliding motility-associated-like protein
METNRFVRRKYFFPFLLSFIFSFFSSSAQMAQFATKGTGNMKNYICWFDWAGTIVTNGASKTFTTPDGLLVKVTFNNVSGPAVVPYVMNTWSGAILWQLYDFVDPSVMPALFSQNTINSVNFTMNISVTRAGVPTPFTFVAADAEASASSEITTINTNGSPWRTIEFYRNSNQTANPLTGCGTQTVKLTLTYGDAPQTGQNPILATDANGSLVINTAMDRQEQGGIALAFGIFAPVDRGDLPTPYPQVQHGLRFTTTNSCNFNAPFPAIVQDASLRLGVIQGDADGAQTTDDNMIGVDEDGISSFPAYDGSGSYTLPLTLGNATGSSAFLTGWFDYNRDGNFSSNESVSVTVPNGAISASLTWTGLPANLPQTSISGFAFRFRLSSNAAEAQSVGGYARDGEVEDYLIDQNVIQDQSFKVGFTIPDTVCVNTPVAITNTSIGASTYYWNFCVADVNATPTGINMGNIGGKLNTPVYMDYVYDNGNYYGFVTNNYPGGLLRLDFGNSLLNVPAVTDLGTVGGVIPFNTEGIQIVKNEGKWYVIIVGGDNFQPVPNPAAIVKIELGTNIANNSPLGTNWGNIGNLAYPHDLYVFDDNGHWYGLTVNTDNNTITKFDFTTSFSNTPSAVNLGNIGNLNGPTGIYAIKDNGNWYAFVTNANSSTLTRLNFGNSLLNTPTGVNLGNIGGRFHICWDIQIMNYCGQNVGFIINAETNDLIKLDFGNSIINIPSVSSYGNIGNMNFPHCLSKVFRDGPDLYCFIPNVNKNSLTRIKFSGCTNSSVPNSTDQNPPSIVYNAPGVYNVNLTINDGLPTQGSVCKQVVVLPAPLHSPTKNVSICNGGAVKIGSPVKSATYQWSSGEISDSIVVTSAGTYWVESNRYGCSVRDTFIVKSAVVPFAVSPLTATICKGDSVQFKANGGTDYAWSPSANFNRPTSPTSKAIINASQDFTVFISDSICRRDTTIVIPVTASPGANISVTKSNDVNCGNDSVILIANGGVSYTWSPNLYISRNAGNKITVKPYQSTTYIVKGKDEFGCYGQDSVTVNFFREGNQKLFMPTAFTPNGDGKNEIFRPTFIGPYAKYDFKIYNRWGQLVYESKVPGTGWDGRVNGIPQKADVYVFFIMAEGGCNGSFVQKGTFLLLR